MINRFVKYRPSSSGRAGWVPYPCCCLNSVTGDFGLFFSPPSNVFYLDDGADPARSHSPRSFAGWIIVMPASIVGSSRNDIRRRVFELFWQSLRIDQGSSDFLPVGAWLQHRVRQGLHTTWEFRVASKRPILLQWRTRFSGSASGMKSGS